MLEPLGKLDPLFAAAIVSGIVGLITGAIGSLIAPWINWGIEKRRMDIQHKREVLRDWRKFVSDYEGKGGDLDMGFQNTSVYAELKPYLKESVRDRFERPRGAFIKKPEYKPLSKNREIIFDEITRIQQEVWKLP